MDIVVVTAELAPHSRWTSVGDACAALPKALRGLGHRVTVLSPLWASIDPSAWNLARRLVKVEVELEGSRHALALFDGRSTAGVELQFLANDALFPSDAAASDEGPRTAARWGAFARAAIELLLRRDVPPDVVHVFGWQTAVLPVLMKERAGLDAVPTVLTIHAPSPQGRYDRAHLATFGISERWWRIDGVEFYGMLSTLKAGIQTASFVTAPGPSFARQMLEQAAGLEGALRARGKSFVGIVDGVDTSVWNPATDPWLEARYDPMDVAGTGRYGKHRCKTALQRELSLPTRDDVALIAVIGAANAASGLDVLAEVGPQILRNDVQIVAALEPRSEAEIVGRLTALAARWPDRMAVRLDADTGAIHRALGAADLLLLPALEAPEAARAMQAQRYGTPPIARRRGAVADAIVDCDAALRSGSGFLFDEPNHEALLGATQRAIGAYARREAFRALQHRVMLVDHSWDRSARLYERIYRLAPNVPREARAPAAPDARA